MAVSITTKDLEKVKREHVKKAFACVREHGEQDDNGIWRLKADKWGLLWVIFDEDGDKYAQMHVTRLAYVYAQKDLGEIEESPPFPNAYARTGSDWANIGYNFFRRIFPEFPIKRLESINTPKGEGSMTEIAKKLLEQFYQIIFHGPPGTGKTRAAKLLLPSLLGVDESKVKSLQGRRWDIVQFHPSYNYEDFVRGIQAEAVGGKVAYEMVNRIFGKMCHKANAAPNGEKYVLIIDEINRANVSAVLGELIYALEYRGHPVNTPYAVKPEDKQEAKSDPTLTIPKNLYVIGTMNTADRTIGQIDYAVRRRFAFYPCPPKRGVVKSENSGLKKWQEVLNIYDDARKLFVIKNDSGKEKPSEFMSPDFDPADVCVGHSYFLPSDKQAKHPLHQIAQKIIWQVIPILCEYVKDGILKESAMTEINKIEIAARELLEGKPLADESEESDSSAENNEKPQYPGNFIFKWSTPDGRRGFGGMGNTTLAIVKDYAERHRDKPKNLDELLSALSLPGNAVKQESEGTPHSCFMGENERIAFPDGGRAVVSFLWTNKPDTQKWKNFAAKAENIGYQIRLCRFANISEGNSRSWADCRKYGFIAAGGKFKDGSEGHRKQIENLQVGEAVFAYWGGEGAPKERRGFVALGTVLKQAVRIDEFKVADGRLLSNCESEKGGSYKNAYPRAFAEGRDVFDYAVSVKWEQILPDSDIVKTPWNENTVRSRTNNFPELRKAFNLGNEEEE